MLPINLPLTQQRSSSLLHLTHRHTHTPTHTQSITCQWVLMHLIFHSWRGNRMSSCWNVGSVLTAARQLDFSSQPGLTMSRFLFLWAKGEFMPLTQLFFSSKRSSKILNKAARLKLEKPLQFLRAILVFAQLMSANNELVKPSNRIQLILPHYAGYAHTGPSKRPGRLSQRSDAGSEHFAPLHTLCLPRRGALLAIPHPLNSWNQISTAPHPSPTHVSLSHFLFFLLPSTTQRLAWPVFFTIETDKTVQQSRAWALQTEAK